MVRKRRGKPVGDGRRSASRRQESRFIQRRGAAHVDFHRQQADARKGIRQRLLFVIHRRGHARHRRADGPGSARWLYPVRLRSTAARRPRPDGCSPSAEFTQLIHHLLCCLRVGICKLAAGEIEGVVRHQPSALRICRAFALVSLLRGTDPRSPRTAPRWKAAAPAAGPGDVFIAEARFFQCGNQQVTSDPPLFTRLPFRSATLWIADCSGTTASVFGLAGSGQGRPDRLAPLGQRPRIAGRGQIDTTDVQPSSICGPAGNSTQRTAMPCFWAKAGGASPVAARASAKIFAFDSRC